jgi:hypothetical protein
MNTRQAVGVRTVDAKPKHSDGVRTQNIGKMMLSRDMDCYVVRTGAGCGTEIQMERSIFGGLRRKQYFKERDRSISNERKDLVDEVDLVAYYALLPDNMSIRSLIYYQTAHDGQVKKKSISKIKFFEIQDSFFFHYQDNTPENVLLLG